MKIAYLTTSFTTLSHTFIRREISGLKSLGLEIYLFGVRPDLSKELSEPEKYHYALTEYLYPLNLYMLISSNMFFLFRSPASYFKTVFRALFNEEINPAKHLILIYHFFVSTVLALKMKKAGIGHIHAHFLNVPATLAMYCAGLLGLTFSMTVHSAGEAELKEMAGVKSKLKRAKFICAVTNFNLEYLDKIYPCRKKCSVVRVGINLDDYQFRGVDNPSIGAARIKLICVGRFVEKKGFQYLIEASNLLKKSGIGFQLSIVGEGELKGKLKILVSDCKLDEFVEFTGAISPEEVKNQLKNHDILVVPSVEAKTGEMEGLPVVIMEAMALGVPVIATAHSGIPEIVKDKDTGLLVPEKDPQAIVEAIKLLKEDAPLRAGCIERARALVEEDFNIKKIAQQKLDLFRYFLQ